MGLIERKERPKVKEEPSPEQGSQLYQTEYTETKRFEHEAFLTDVVGKPVGGKQIAIIGEPGAGKTTILTKIGAWLIQQAEQQPPAPLVVAWISLADVGDRSLEKYLKKKWLQKVCEDNFDVAWEDWKRLRQQGRVWLLLDGLDEMSGDALAAIHRDLGLAWAQNLRVVMTCRLNQWETAAGGNVLTNSFDVYRTLDYSYQTSQGEDQVKEFISKWFADNEKVATQIRTELDAPGKERIKDLVKNPLRLTLLCASWEKDHQALPETQADLYRGFVNYLYKWKAKEFKDEVKLRQELDLALGELAKAGLNRQPINDGAVRRFRFTASEISGLWADRSDALLPAAKNLGWLNVVGEEAGDDVYAFYHPTFQEYFAACSIDDWDYFLPRAHVDQPMLCESGANLYRVFEQEWRQVILLWMGRRDEVVKDELKEQFIDKLTDFREQEGEFYYYRAYCMAAICVGEFQTSRQAESIVQQIVKWAFEYFDTEKQKWRTCLYPIESLARETILSTHRGYAIAALVPLVENPALHYLPRRRVTEILGILGQIDVGNKDAIDSLVQLLKLCFPDSLNLSRAFGNIAVGDRSTIDCVIQLLRQNVGLNDGNNFTIAYVLGEIAVRDRATIDFLFELLKNNNCYGYDFYNVAAALGKISIGDRAAIDSTIHILENGNLVCRHGYIEQHYDAIVSVLGNIAVGDRPAINFLLQTLKCEDLKDSTRHHSIEGLGTIASGNPDAINSLIQILNHHDVSNSLRITVAEALGNIDVGNRLAIDSLIQILHHDSLDNIYIKATKVLRKIAIGNRIVIKHVIQLLQREKLDRGFAEDLWEILGDIAIGDRTTIDSLMQILEHDNLDDSRYLYKIKILRKIAIKETLSLIIYHIKSYLINKVYKSNSQLSDKRSCDEILFKCAQTLSYPEFHTAWHQTHLPTLR